LDGLGQDQRGERPNQAPRPVGALDQRAVGDQGAHHLLDEEGIALGSPHDLVANRLGEVSHQVIDERAALCVPERGEGDLVERHAAVVRLGDLPDARRRLAGLGARREPERHGVISRERNEVLREGDGGLVHPVPVLHDEHEGPTLRQLLEELVHAEEHLAPERLRVEELQPLLVLAGHFQGQHGREIGHDLRRAGPEQIAHRSFELRPGLALGIGLPDRAAGLDDLDERPVAQMPTEGERAALEPAHALRAWTAPHLGDQPGLADPGLAAEHDHASAPFSQRRERGFEDDQFVLAAHEWGARAPAVAVGSALVGDPWAAQVIDRHRLGDALQLMLAERFELEVRERGTLRGLADANRPRLGV